MAEGKSINPLTPLDTVATTHEEEQQKLLSSPPPPSYDQSIGTTLIPTPHTVVVVTQPPTLPYGPEPVDMQCPFCHNQIRTRIRYLPTTRTHLVAALLCLFQLYCCVCLPYCLSSCMNTQHYCGMCDRYLGTYQRP